MSCKPSFLTELKRRNDYKVAIAYTVMGWLLTQIASQAFQLVEILNWPVRFVVLAIVVGFAVALIWALAYS